MKTGWDKFKNKIFVSLFQIPWVKERWTSQYNALESDSIPWTPLSKPLSQCKLALITTGGVHLKTDPPFNMSDPEGDPSYRKIPSNIAIDQLMITHDYFDHKDADQDINLVLPIEIVRGFQQEGRIGQLADHFYGLMGHIEGQHLDTLVKKTAKVLAKQMKQESVDVALLVPA
ncbi:MAG: hypothetical protein HQM12_14665 [SAR324 cluster bacterium]|nr:hypothetical protein [SAR324 cluster bacterium]